MLACTTDEHAADFSRVTGVDIPAPVLEHDAQGDVARTIEAALATRTTDEWLKVLLPIGVPAAPCLSVAEMFADEHLNANNLWWDTEHPQWGDIRQTGRLVHWSEMSMHLQRRAPLAGEHTAECLSELGIGARRIEELLAAGVLAQAEPPAPPTS
jgi:formyl-CoA transferase